MPQTGAVKTLAIPAPVGGKNSRDPLDLMEPIYAIRMVNWWPTTSGLELRPGYTPHVSSGISGNTAVQTIVAHQDRTGAEKLLVVSGGNFYNGTSTTPVAVTGGVSCTTDRWQHTVFQGSTILVNGTNTPVQYAGASPSDAVTGASYTGTYAGYGGGSLTTSNLIQVNQYRHRLYFVEKDADRIWYGGLNAKTGALGCFQFLSDLFRFGGYPMATATWSIDAGNGLGDHLVIISNKGEVLVYSGDYPASANWQMVLRGKIAPPLGRRCFVNIGTNLAILTHQGLLPLSQTLLQQSQSGSFENITDNIDTDFLEAAEDYRSNTGWECIVWPDKNMLITNVPLTSNSQTRQLAMNTKTGAWTEFRDVPAAAWCVMGDELYFGDFTSGIHKFTGRNDNSAFIETDLKLAFNYFQDRNSQKQMQLAAPVLEADGDVSMYFDVDMDLQDRNVTSQISITGDPGTSWGDPWGSPWSAGETRSRKWYSIRGIGRCAALLMRAQFKDITVKLTGFRVGYTDGGIL